MAFNVQRFANLSPRHRAGARSSRSVYDKASKKGRVAGEGWAEAHSAPEPQSVVLREVRGTPPPRCLVRSDFPS